jgi:hypothetical protein
LSLQLHLRVRPEDFARFYNAAQITSIFQIAAGANSPFLFGGQLWAESRIPLCEQVLDIRPPADGAPPRVWFGDHWVAGATELFAENIRGFIPLLPCLDDPDPGESLSRGRVPRLGELRMHGGTIWRWNRPVYDVQSGKPQLRIENRVLPSGPTPADMVANAAFYYGLIRTLADEESPAWHRIPFETARNAFYEAARYGLDVAIEWEGGREVGVVDLVMGALARAADGLDAWGIDRRDRDHYLAIIQDRVESGRTGAWWQTTVTHHLQDHGMSRDAALTEMTRTYAELASRGRPVHTWPVKVERAS